MNLWNRLKGDAGRAMGVVNAWRHHAWLSEFSRLHPDLWDTIRRVEEQHLTYLDRVALVELASIVLELEQSKRGGDLIEAGCAWGGSAIVLASAKQPGRTLRIYDRFGLIPEPTTADGHAVARRYAEIVQGTAVGPGKSEYYGYHADLASAVRENFRELGFPVEAHGVQLIEGLFAETMHNEGPIALAHIDCDWYESVKICLQRLAPCLVKGGRFVIDDYWHWQGCRKAVDEFLAMEPGFEPKSSRSGRMHLIRRANQP